MKKDQLRECVGHKNWRWTPGMKAVGRRHSPEAWFRLEEEVQRLHGEWSKSLPDLGDPATVGALLGLVRSLHSDPSKLWGGHVEVHRDHRKVFTVVQPYHDEEGELCYYVLASGETEAEALIQTIIMEKDSLRSVDGEVEGIVDNAVRDTVYWEVNGAVNGVVSRSTDWAVSDVMLWAANWDVSDAVYWAVGGVVYWAKQSSPMHPALQEFLREASTGAGFE